MSFAFRTVLKASSNSLNILNWENHEFSLKFVSLVDIYVKDVFLGNLSSDNSVKRDEE